MDLTHPIEDERGRPILDRIFDQFAREIRACAPDTLGHLDPDAILFVSGSARREARASIRPLTFGLDKNGTPKLISGDGHWKKPIILRQGRQLLYEICLRPRFFLGTTPAMRARVLIHELWHIAIAFDGTLELSRRHRSGKDFEGAVEAIAERWRPSTNVLEHHGEMRLSAWLSRPPSRIPREVPMRDLYDERDLFSAIVVQS